MTREQFLKVTGLVEYEVRLSGKKRIGTQLKLNKIISKSNGEKSNSLQTGQAVETEAADPITPIPAAIDREQSPRFAGKSKEIFKLNKKLGDFKTFRMNRSNWENQPQTISTLKGEK